MRRSKFITNPQFEVEFKSVKRFVIWKPDLCVYTLTAYYAQLLDYFTHYTSVLFQQCSQRDPVL